MPKLSAQARARKVRILLFDVDGVLTDGKLFFLPDRDRNLRPGSEFSSQGSLEFKGFHAHDGVAISLARVAGLRTGLITTRSSETVTLRARDLKMEYARQGIQDKCAAFAEIVKDAGLRLDQAAFVGDDLIDLPAMRAAGFAVAVKNARGEVKKEAHYVTPHSGGDGALRDVVEFILKAQGRWRKLFEAYLSQHTPRLR